MKTSRSLLAAACLALALAVPSAPSFADALGLPPAGAAKFPEVLATADTLQQLRKGGYALYLRHGPTNNTIPDRASGVDLNDCSTQRPLTPAGHEIARQVGDAMRKARIPLEEIRISPLCRVKDTVAAAFPGRAHTVDNELMYTANFTDAQKAPIIANTKRWLATPVAAGKNRLLIAHAPNLMDLMGYFPKEATLVIFQPLGADKGIGYEYVASIPPTHWGELLK